MIYIGQLCSYDREVGMYRSRSLLRPVQLRDSRVHGPHCCQGRACNDNERESSTCHQVQLWCGVVIRCVRGTVTCLHLTRSALILTLHARTATRLRSVGGILASGACQCDGETLGTHSFVQVRLVLALRQASLVVTAHQSFIVRFRCEAKPFDVRGCAFTVG